MKEEKTLQQEILEENQIISDYKSKLEIAYKKVNQINNQCFSLNLVKKSKSLVEKYGSFIGTGILLFGLTKIAPSFTTTMEWIVSSLGFVAGAAVIVFQLKENAELKQKIKQDPYYEYFKNLSKKELTKKQEQIEKEKKYEKENIESLKKCIEIEENELTSLIEKCTYQEKIKEVVGKELEKTFLRYLDEKPDYSNIHFETQPQEKVKIKSKVR